MVKVEGKGRILRAWELGLTKIVQKNPFGRKIKSPDAEETLRKARKTRKEALVLQESGTSVPRGKNAPRSIPVATETIAPERAQTKILRKTVKKVQLSKEIKETIQFINEQRVLAVRGDSNDPYWLCKRIGRTRMAVIEDERRSNGMVKRGTYILTVKWYERSGKGRTYKLINGTQYLSINSVYLTDEFEFSKSNKTTNTHELALSDHKQIMLSIKQLR